MREKQGGGPAKIIIVRETALQSWARDAGSVCAAAVLILPGWWLGATWLSATGFLLFWVWLFNASFRAHKKHTFSVAEAKAEIDRIGADTATERNTP